ncbi:MAG: GNAT family N-acetyltransferase [Methanomicrobiales archaeon]|nr:GNAT family N-acetyltransferase [Methanomicrobiales archaeon]
MLSGTIPGIFSLSKKDIILAAEMLTSSFASDPKTLHLFTDQKSELFSALFRFEISYGIRYGWVHTLSSPPVGVAIWLMSDKSEITFIRALFSGGMALQRSIGKENMNRLLDFSQYIDKKHAVKMPYHHLYLFVLGVHPDFQGQGVAGKLLRPVLERLEKTKTDCYLTIQNEKNVSLNEHFGFEPISRGLIEGMDIPLITMKKTV